MSELGLNVVDARTLDDVRRELLRPGELVTDARGRRHVLPRFFYEIESWEQAKRTQLSAHFRLSELIAVDCREAPLLLEEFPHYVPCAVAVLARYLEAFRQRVESPVFIAVNGGYRSPAHALSSEIDPHLWGTAAEIYRVGDTFLDDQSSIEKYGRFAASAGPDAYVKPYGHGENEADDHLYFDMGYVIQIPRDADEAL